MNQSEMEEEVQLSPSKQSDMSGNEQETPDLLKNCQQELQQWKDQCLRTAADFENFKKRTEREKIAWIASTQAGILQDILVVADNVERALAELHKRPVNEEIQPWVTGFELVNKAVAKLLEKYEVQEIKDHDLFDPQFHEAIMHVDSSEHISGAVVQVLQKGYLFKGNVLRPAKVSVAK